MLIDKSPALKNAVLSLPIQEKDKLLLKLISKDIVLLNQLTHKLLEEESDLDERVGCIKKDIDRKIEYINRYFENDYSYSPGYFMMDIREMSGLINEHFLVTKHKISELDLRIYLLECVFNCSANTYFNKRNGKSEKLLLYIVGRIKSIIEKYLKLHEDIQFDFKDRLNFVLDFAHGSELKYEMENLNL